MSRATSGLLMVLGLLALAAGFALGWNRHDQFQAFSASYLVNYMFKQGRFAHLKSDENKHIVDEIQADVDSNWEGILAKTGGEVQKV